MHTSIRDNAASSSVANLRRYPVAREAMNDSCSSASTSCASKLTVVVNAGEQDEQRDVIRNRRISKRHR